MQKRDKIKKIEPEQYRQSFLENEFDANRHMVRASVFAAAALALLWMGYLTRLFTINDHYFLIVNIVIPSILVLLLTPLLLYKLNKSRNAWFKYYVVFLFLFAVSIMNIVIPKHAVLAWVIPILLTNHYYNPKMGWIVFGSTIGLMLGCLYLSMFFGEYDNNVMLGGVDASTNLIVVLLTSETFPDSPAGRFEYLAHLASLGYNRYLTAFGFYYVSRAVLIGVTFYISLNLNKRTNTLLRDAVTITSEQEKTKSELTFASDIQQAALPDEYYVDQRVEIIGQLEAAKEVGGDFYDYVPLDDTHIALVIGDVSGKGVPAALFMMRTLSSIKSSLSAQKTPKEILERVNQDLIGGNSGEMFVTCFLAILNTQTGRLRYANAGHNPPILGRNQRFFTLPCKKGFVLGATDDCFFEDEIINIKVGDTLLLYTDGVTEARNAKGEFFGDKHLLSFLNKRGFNCLIGLHHDLADTLHEFHQGVPQADDITYLFLHLFDGHREWREKTFDATENNVSEILSYIEDFGNAISMSRKDLSAILIISDEMVSNIVKYAYDGKEGDLHIRLYYQEKQQHFTMTLIDSGKRFNQLKLEEKSLSGNVQDQRIGGLGVLITKELIDDASYDYLNKHNILSLGVKVNVRKA